MYVCTCALPRVQCSLKEGELVPVLPPLSWPIYIDDEQ